jgi:hypothetical protein
MTVQTLDNLITKQPYEQVTGIPLGINNKITRIF